MMDVLERILRVARAHLNTGRQTPWEDAGSYRKEFPPGDTGARAEEAPSQDPRLAGYYANLELPYGADLQTVRQAAAYTGRTNGAPPSGDDALRTERRLGT